MVVGYSSDIGPHPERLDLVYDKVFRSPADLAALLRERGEKKVREQRRLYDQARATFEELPAALRDCFPRSLSYDLKWSEPWPWYNVGKFKVVVTEVPVVRGSIQINPLSDHALAGLEVVVGREGIKHLAVHEERSKEEVLARILDSVTKVLVYGHDRLSDPIGSAEHLLKAA